ncbi:MAG: tetratricopeptide repeat protein [Bdellovibrionota bacterium]
MKSSIAIDSGNKETHYELGMVYVAKNDSKSALTEFEKAIQIDGKHALSWYEKARLLDEKSQRQRKEQAYIEAITANNQFTEARWELGNLYLKNEQYPNAIRSVSWYLKYDPDNRGGDQIGSNTP